MRVSGCVSAYCISEGVFGHEREMLEEKEKMRVRQRWKEEK